MELAGTMLVWPARPSQQAPQAFTRNGLAGQTRTMSGHRYSIHGPGRNVMSGQGYFEGTVTVHPEGVWS